MGIVNTDVFMWKNNDCGNVELVKGIYYSDVSIIQSFPVVFQNFIYSSGDVCSILMFSEHNLLVMHLMHMAFLQFMYSIAQFAVLRKQYLNMSLTKAVWKIIGSYNNNNNNN
jgi:hypothetical protein